MDRGNTEYIPFCGWYKCRSCGVTEHFIPSQCPVCLKHVDNYTDKTQRVQEEMIRIRESEEDISW